MQQNNVSLWSKDKSLDCMLFFAQRVNELLFHHTTDTYRIPALSLRGLAVEYCAVYKDAKKGIINAKNLKHIIDEFNDRLQKDPIATDILSLEYVDRFDKSYGSWDVKEQFENINYIGRKLSNLAYYHAVVKKLHALIIENKEKKLIDRLTTIWVREVIDCGYNENYVFKMLHNMFFHNEVSSIDCIDQFFKTFDFDNKKFDVFIGFSKNMDVVKNLFEKIRIPTINISVLKPQEAPQGIKTKLQQTILKIENIQAYDMYSAYEIAYEIAACVTESYSFFRHDGSPVNTYGQVVCEDKTIVRIKPKHLLKYRVSSLSQPDSGKKAEGLLQVLFSNMKNQSDVRKIVKIHNCAIKSENINDALISLWSLMESLVDDDISKPKQNSSEQADDKSEDSKYKSGNVIEMLIPFLKSAYVYKLVQTFVADIIHWNREFFDAHISNNGFGTNDVEHAFAFLTFDALQSDRDALYASTSDYPLLKNRVMVLYEQLHDSKKIKATMSEHEKRIRWHFHRIYRARNYIVHDADSNDELNHELLINLHSYIDTAVLKAVELINASPYNDNIMDVILEHKLEVSIFDEKLEKQENEDISEDNALKYLYYDYER